MLSTVERYLGMLRSHHLKSKVLSVKLLENEEVRTALLTHPDVPEAYKKLVRQFETNSKAGAISPPEGDSQGQKLAAAPAPPKKTKRQQELDKELARDITGTAIAAGVGLHKLQDPKRHEIKLDKATKRIAIVYPGGNVGSGHEVPAGALEKFYKKKGFRVDKYNVSDYQNRVVKKLISNNYASWVSENPAIHMPTGTKVDPMVRAGLETPLADKIRQAKKSGGKDGVSMGKKLVKELGNLIAGHYSLLDDMKKTNYSKVIAMHGTTADLFKSVGVPVDVLTTDFVPDPFAWKSDSGSNYYVGTREAKERLKAVGVGKDKIKNVGSLMVREEFKRPDKWAVPDTIASIKEQQAKLPDGGKVKGVKPKVITIAGGGTGIQVDIVAERLSNYYLRKNPNTKIVVVTANNKKAFDKLTNKQALGALPNLVVKGKVMPDIDPTGIRKNRGLGAYFKHSDIVVTRPGGSTTAELLHTGTPTVTYNQGPLFKDWKDLGSHETGNTKVLHSKGMSEHFQMKHRKGSSPIVENMQDLDKEMDKIEKNYKHYKNNATKTMESYVKKRPEREIFKTVSGPQRKVTHTMVGKGVLGAALAGTVYGAHKIKQNYEDRKKLKNRQPFFKI